MMRLRSYHTAHECETPAALRGPRLGRPVGRRLRRHPSRGPFLLARSTRAGSSRAGECALGCGRALSPHGPADPTRARATRARRAALVRCLPGRPQRGRAACRCRDGVDVSPDRSDLHRGARSRIPEGAHHSESSARRRARVRGCRGDRARDIVAQRLARGSDSLPCRRAFVRDRRRRGKTGTQSHVGAAGDVDLLQRRRALLSPLRAAAGAGMACCADRRHRVAGFLGVFPTSIAFTTWAYALARGSAGRLAATAYLVPPITIVMSWLILDEVPTVIAVLGGALCLVGVAIARKAPAVRASPPAPVPAPPARHR